MAYSEGLAERIRGELGAVPFVEKRMFGGVGFLVHGNMACGVHKDDMIVRVDPGRHAELLARPHVRPFAITGRPMMGWLVVEPEGCASAEQLRAWVGEGVGFVLTLPPKEP